MELRLLESGYWFAQWHGEAWAQWHRRFAEPCRDDFFHPEWTYSYARVVECRNAIVSRLAESGAQK